MPRSSRTWQPEISRLFEPLNLPVCAYSEHPVLPPGLTLDLKKAAPAGISGRTGAGLHTDLLSSSWCFSVRASDEVDCFGGLFKGGWAPPHFAEKRESFWKVVESPGIPQGWCFLLASLGLLSLKLKEDTKFGFSCLTLRPLVAALAPHPPLPHHCPWLVPGSWLFVVWAVVGE